MSLRLFICFALALALPQTVFASKDRLNTFFKEVTSLQARFDQVVMDEAGSTLARSSGNFYLQRPGKFRWDYIGEDPDFPQGQQIYSDGKLITFFDPDLETATQRSLVDALEQVPTLALVQSGESIEAFFTISDYGLTDGLTWVGLKPKDESSAYQGLLLGFDSNNLKSIVLTDGLGNETRLMLEDVKTNTRLKKSIFSFDAPSGVDVIRE